jgi:hypothetical protein
MNSSRIPIALFVLSLAVSIAAWGQATPPSTETPAERNLRVHSHIYHADYGTGFIARKLAGSTGDITVVDDQDARDNDYVSSGPASDYPPTRLVEWSCYTDAAVVATALVGGSHMTDNGSFVYTEWKFKVKEVLQDNPKAPIGATITVVRAGGELLVNGRKVIGEEQNFPAFTPGTNYMMFLTYIPETGAYKANGLRSFDVSGDTLPAGKRVPYGNHDYSVSVKSEDLLRDTRAAVAKANGWPACATVKGEIR